MGTDEFFELTGVPINTQKDWRAKGSVRGPQSAVIGGKIKYRRSDVLAWLDEQFNVPVKQKGKSLNNFTPLGNRSLATAAS
ncbi:helix-turn-helix domain-containing protein [Mycolicibacterium farcinogenes]|uniref:Helix-turn-helix domain-containing protein n=1 Tax=Mycolicibacterium farcinogenes TaxID=1802 RepID=A0ACD1FCJ1_MYCFR|nr:helix-turn-helix domain-containing protein [Mycolicibacterium farcinogenes]QZH64725.1 helix-turn-helix domain-containing protein [Mycolicibacterium farcinogenes]